MLIGLPELPAAEQQHSLDGITLRTLFRRAGHPASDKDELDPNQGDSAGQE